MFNNNSNNTNRKSGIMSLHCMRFHFSPFVSPNNMIYAMNSSYIKHFNIFLLIAVMFTASQKRVKLVVSKKAKKSKKKSNNTSICSILALTKAVQLTINTVNSFLWLYDGYVSRLGREERQFFKYIYVFTIFAMFMKHFKIIYCTNQK